MKKSILLTAAALVSLLAGTAFAQIRINIPGVTKPKPTPTPTPAPASTPAPTAPTVTGGSRPQATVPSQPATAQTSAPATQSSNAPKWMLPPEWNEQLAIIRESIEVQLDTTESYWKAPGQSNYTSWYPLLKFNVAYKSTLAPRLQVDWFNPDGSLWFTDQIKINFSNLYDTKREEAKFQKATNMGGTYGFKITDTRSGAVLFEGKFKVTKFPDTNGSPLFKNTFGFAVDHDGELPYGFVWLDYKTDNLAPQVKVSMWLKGDDRIDSVEARLFYNGEEISTTDAKGGSASSSMDRRPNKAWDKYPEGNYKFWNFAWPVRYLYKQSGNTSYPGARFINGNDGTYTVKVFVSGSQVREASFNVKNGMIEGNGIAEANGYTGESVVIPVTLLKSAEKWNPASVKGGDFYGNPFKTSGAPPAAPTSPSTPPATAPQSGGANAPKSGPAAVTVPANQDAIGPWMKPVTPTNQIVFEKESLEIRCDTKERYWKFPDQSYYSSWVPRLKFKVTYNNDTTPRLVAEYFTPDGKSWFTEPLNYSFNEVTTPYSNDERFKNGQVTPGVYGVKITDTRSNAVLFEGKFRVVKFKWGESTPMYKNQFGFATDFDGALQVGQVRLDYKRSNDAPQVVVGMWIKEPKNLYRSDLEARMYLNGQEIATTDDRGQSEQVETRSPNSSNYYPDGRYEFWEFRWPVRYFALKTASGYPTDRFINQGGDGEYTVKLFYKGEQIRETSFTVSGGAIMDNGVTLSNGFSGFRAMIPVKVMGAKDKWNPTNAKTDGFWGKPVKGIH